MGVGAGLAARAMAGGGELVEFLEERAEGGGAGCEDAEGRFGAGPE